MSEVQKAHIEYSACCILSKQNNVTASGARRDYDRYDNPGWADGFKFRMLAQKSSSVSFLRCFKFLPFFVRFSNFALGPETWVRSSVLEGLASSS